MDEEDRSRDRAGRRSKRFLTPMQKYEIYLQVIRGEVTMAEAAASAGVDRTTVVRIRQVAKDGALAALAESRPGIKPGTRDVEGRSESGNPSAIGNGQRNGREVDAGRGKRRLGIDGRVPRRVDAATKAELLELLDRAVGEGWSVSAAAGGWTWGGSGRLRGGLG